MLSYTVVRINIYQKDKALNALKPALTPVYTIDYGDYTGLFYDYYVNYRLVCSKLDTVHISSEVYNNTNWQIDIENTRSEYSLFMENWQQEIDSMNKEN